MQVWKLISHGAELDPQVALDFVRDSGRLAVGWGVTGDLDIVRPKSAEQIAQLIRIKYPDATNSSTGGPSLWNLWSEVQIGDLVIVVGGGKRRFVAEITGPYVWASPSDSPADYYHQRAFVETSTNPDALWDSVGASVADGQNPHLTLARCGDSVRGAGPVPTYMEGAKFEIRATARERDGAARAKCLQLHGFQCFVCGFDFESVYGEIGREFIHVHHLKPLSDGPGEVSTEPEHDLVPLCPNCHAMVHRESPPLTPEALKARMSGA